MAVTGEEGVAWPISVEAAVLAHARAAAPSECCGLLLGRADRVVEARPTQNVAADPLKRYEIDPVAHLDAIRDARRRALEVVGAYHSHPRGAATPSPRDVEQAFGEFLFVIVGLGRDEPVVCGWQWIGGNFAAVRLVRVE
jgi:proteasome lid subunit RPN8/RPN11